MEVEKSLKRIKKTTQANLNHEHTYFYKSLTGIEKDIRLKRDTIQTKYYVQYLVVVDSTTVELFNLNNGNLGKENIEDFIKIQYQFVVMQVKLI